MKRAKDEGLRIAVVKVLVETNSKVGLRGKLEVVVVYTFW